MVIIKHVVTQSSTNRHKYAVLWILRPSRYERRIRVWHQTNEKLFLMETWLDESCVPRRPFSLPLLSLSFHPNARVVLKWRTNAEYVQRQYYILWVWSIFNEASRLFPVEFFCCCLFLPSEYGPRPGFVPGLFLFWFLRWGPRVSNGRLRRWIIIVFCFVDPKSTCIRFHSR